MAEFKKTSAQKSAIIKIAKSKATNIMLFGGARSSKTFTVMYILCVRACKCKSNHIVVRSTFNSVKITIWMDTLPTVLRLAFPTIPIKWDKSNYIATFPNGSTIRIAGLDNKEKLERLLGLECSTIAVEECNQIPFTAIQKLKSRLAEKNILAKKVFYTQNPTTKTSAYYQIFEQAIDPIGAEALSEEEAKDYLSIKMNPVDNIDNIDPDFLKMMNKLPEAERKRFLLGDYSDDNADAAVYAFSQEHVTDEAKRINGTVWVGSDFNIEYNSDVLCSQTSHCLHVWGEIQIGGDTYKKVNELCKRGASGASIVCDSTGGARRTSANGMTDHLILRQAGFTVTFRTNPNVKDKIANLNRCFTLGLIKINPSCRKLIRDLTQLVWDKHGQLDQKTDPSLSHLVDALAYLCWTLYPIVDMTWEKPKGSR